MDSLELELEMEVRCRKWVQGMELGPSARSTSALGLVTWFRFWDFFGAEDEILHTLGKLLYCSC